ncbi:MAG TPA: rRNA methyltransferase [Alphaproteobacteria bacterium]|nr:rRNA methyltransferase [Alphaproteobacteria bacterium]
MIFPPKVRFLLEQTNGLKQTAADISLRYRTGRDKSLKTAAEAAAYAATRMPATFGAVARALELTLETLETPPETLLDVGAGTGAATLAAQQLLDLKSAICLERAAVMRDLGQKLVAADWRTIDIMADDLPETADLVVASYMLNEVADPIFAARKLWNAAESVLLIVESALPESVALLQKIRTDLTERGAHVAAPCPHDKPCAEWCHFACRIERSRLHKQLKGGDAPFEDEKFSFIALTKAPALRRSARVLRHPQIGTNKVGLTLCTPDGIIEKTVFKPDKALYKIARKAKTGDAL